jgi:Ca2+-binding EF-hand superfamily protein
MSGKLKKPAVRRSDSVMQFASELGTDHFNRMKEVFALYADSKGRVNVSQLLQVLNTLNINSTKDECSTFFNELDSDQDGFIDFTVFIRGLKWIKTSAVINSPQAQEPRAISRTKSIKQFVDTMDEANLKRTKEIFAMCDSDGDGVITKSELFKLVKELGLEMTKVEVSLLFSTLDVNNDGKLQFQEFLEGMRWLNKGMNVATTRDKEAASSSAPSQERASEMALQDALDSNKILITFIKDLVAKSLETAKSEIQAGKLRTADILLQIVDVDRLNDLSVMIGTVVDKKDVALYHKMVGVLQEKAKESAAARK